MVFKLKFISQLFCTSDNNLVKLMSHTKKLIYLFKYRHLWVIYSHRVPVTKRVMLLLNTNMLIKIHKTVLNFTQFLKHNKKFDFYRIINHRLYQSVVSFKMLWYLKQKVKQSCMYVREEVGSVYRSQDTPIRIDHLIPCYQSYSPTC